MSGFPFSNQCFIYYCTIVGAILALCILCHYIATVVDIMITGDTFERVAHVFIEGKRRLIIGGGIISINEHFQIYSICHVIRRIKNIQNAVQFF